ncbi:hypothetical protein ROZALSC1DRAFT_28790, partial [Rozella allomycis CSF55]
HKLNEQYNVDENPSFQGEKVNVFIGNMTQYMKRNLTELQKINTRMLSLEEKVNRIDEWKNDCFATNNIKDSHPINVSRSLTNDAPKNEEELKSKIKPEPNIRKIIIQKFDSVKTPKSEISQSDTTVNQTANLCSPSFIKDSINITKSEIRSSTRLKNALKGEDRENHIVTPQLKKWSQKELYRFLKKKITVDQPLLIKSNRMKDLWNRWQYGVDGFPPYSILEKSFGNSWRGRSKRWSGMKRPLALMVAYHTFLKEITPEKCESDLVDILLRTFHKPITVINKEIKVIHKGYSHLNIMEYINRFLDEIKEKTSVTYKYIQGLQWSVSIK